MYRRPGHRVAAGVHQRGRQLDAVPHVGVGGSGVTTTLEEVPRGRVMPWLRTSVPAVTMTSLRIPGVKGEARGASARRMYVPGRRYAMRKWPVASVRPVARTDQEPSPSGGVAAVDGDGDVADRRGVRGQGVAGDDAAHGAGRGAVHGAEDGAEHERARVARRVAQEAAPHVEVHHDAGAAVSVTPSGSSTSA